MFGLALLSLALLSFAVSATMIWAEDKYRGNLVPPKMPVLSWLNCERHWHSFGHYMLEVGLTMTVGVSCISAAMAFSLDPVLIFMAHRSYLTAFLFMIPAILLVLVKEIVADGHWRFFVGQDPKWLDFLFDVATHVLGAAFAALLMLAVFHSAL